MKNYNFDLAKKIITTISDLTEIESASLGMQEDWFWTAQNIWENGKYLIELPSNETAKQLDAEYRKKCSEGMSMFSDEAAKYNCIMIGRIYGSNWATPVLQIDFKDGDVKVYECHDDGIQEIDTIEKIKRAIEVPSGCLSAPVQINRADLQVEKFNL